MQSESRREKIVRYLTESRAEMQLEPLDAKRLQAGVDAWLSRLDCVPDSALDDCYVLAMENHTTRTAVIPQELREAWKSVRNRSEMIPSHRDQKCPLGCSEAGFIVVDFVGESLNEYGSVIRYKGYTYAKPCPYHRMPLSKEKNDELMRQGGPAIERRETMDVKNGPLMNRDEFSGPSTWKSASSVAPKLPEFDDDEPPF